MSNETKTQQLENFIIRQDGEVITPPAPGLVETARQNVLDSLERSWDSIKLESRMVVFDALHGTKYRRIRHELIEQKKRADFEASIGLVKK